MMLQEIEQVREALQTAETEGASLWHALEAWMAPAAIFVIAAVLGYVAKFVIVRKITQVSAKTKTDLDDLVVAAIRGHIPFWFVLGGVALATRNAPLTTERVTHIDLLLLDALILSLTLVISNLVTGLVLRGTARADGTLASSSLLKNVVRGTIVTIGLLVVIHKHYNITPILGALGIGSLAVALALQPTLSNLFAGLHITLAKPLRIGDFVELESGQQGFVVDIGWRATKLRQGANNLVIVPNARLVEMVAKNYSLPEPEQTIALTVGVSYASDLEVVERVTLEVARELRDHTPEAVKTFEPLVRFHTFNASSIDLDVVLRVTNFPDRPLLLSQLIKRLKARFEREKIVIPFPQQVVHQIDN